MQQLRNAYNCEIHLSLQRRGRWCTHCVTYIYYTLTLKNLRYMLRCYLWTFHQLLKVYTEYNKVIFLADKLETKFSLSSSSIIWIVDFLSGRTQSRSTVIYTDHIHRLPSRLCFISIFIYIIQQLLHSHFFLDHFFKLGKRENPVLNTSKTEEMSAVFGKGNSFQPTFINREPIKSVTYSKFLSFILHCKLKS